MRSALLGLGVLALACAAAPPPARAPSPPTVSVAPPERAPDPEPPPPTGPLRLDGDGERAPWLDPPTPLQGRKRYVYDSLLASGDRAAITKTSVGEHFGFDEALGVVGPLELPAKTKQVLFGPADSVLVVSEDGRLFAAPSVSAAKSAAAFEARTAPAGATLWDSAADHLVASDGKRVHLSRDGGKSWSVTQSAAWGTLRTVVVRFDGVMAAQGGPAKAPLTFLSRDGGKSWQRSAFQPERSISRSGSFIWSDVWSCTAVLSENGSTWSKGGDELSRFRQTRHWAASLGSGATPEGFVAGAHRTLSEPPPPKVPGAKDRRSGRGCPAPKPVVVKGKQYGLLGLLGKSGDVGDVFGSIESGAVGFGSIGVGGLGGIGYSGRGPSEPSFGSCKGASCLRPPLAEPTKTRTRFELFRDGRCATAGTGKSCGGSFERPPHVAIFDESSGKRRVADLPPGCRPASIVSAAGLGVLTCATSSGLVLYTADASGAFKEEASLSDSKMTTWSWSVASDGTLLFHERCAAEQPCRALVRRAAAPGQKAWRELKLAGAVGYRALTRGRVLGIARGDADGSLDFSLSEPGKPEAPLVRGVALEGDLMDVRVDDQGRIVVRERRDPSRSESFVVGVDGKRYPL